MIDGLWALFHKGDYETLIPHIRGLLTQHANVADLHFLLAQSLHNSFQEPDRAEFHYTRAKVLGFDRYWVWRGRGRLRREQGQYALALRDFTLALMKRPFFPATPQNPQPRLESDPVAKQRNMVDGLWAQPSPHFLFCDSKVVGWYAKSSRHLQREAGPADRVTPRVT